MYYFVSLVVLHKPVALLSPSCRLPVAFLSPSCRKKTPCRSPVALLSLSCRFLLSLPCRFPVAASPVALLSSSCRFPVAYPVAMSCFLSLPCRLPVATLSPPCRPPVALLSQLSCRLPVACLSLPVAFLPLSCRFPVVFLSPPCRLPVATLSPSCRSLPHFTVACLAWPESIRKQKCSEVFAHPLLHRGLCKTTQSKLKSSVRPVPQLSRYVLRAPACQFLVKWKSTEKLGILKLREVLTQAAHLLAPGNGLMGRALSQFWKFVLTVLKPGELLSMRDILQLMRQWHETVRQPRKGEKAFWLELDLVEMFPRIPRHAVIAAREFLHSKLGSPDTKYTRGPLRLWIAKSKARGADSNCTCNKQSFRELCFADIVHCCKFELSCNTQFVCLSSILQQIAGVPIGGTCSAQLASLTLYARELEHARPIPATPSIRYCDNFLAHVIVRRSVSARTRTWGEAVTRRAKIVQAHIEKLTGMCSTIEQIWP